jgi:hypothetical protein
MINTYAKIQNGIVVNMQLAQASDYFDPSFTWVIITTQVCSDGSPVQIGCATTDNVNFTPQSGN